MFNFWPISKVMSANFSMAEFAGFHGVKERIKVDEYGRSIAFFYKLKVAILFFERNIQAGRL